MGHTAEGETMPMIRRKKPEMIFCYGERKEFPADEFDLKSDALVHCCTHDPAGKLVQISPHYQSNGEPYPNKEVPNLPALRPGDLG